MKTVRNQSVHIAVAFATAVAIYSTMMASGQEQAEDHLIAVVGNLVAFPDVEPLAQTSERVSIRKNEWTFTVEQEPDRQVLRAESVDKLVTQSITPDAVHKRFVFDLKKQRFEPMRQEIRIENTNKKSLQQIETMKGVTSVKRYQRLGFSILKIDIDVNPVEVLRVVRDELENDDARILTGIFDDEPM